MKTKFIIIIVVVHPLTKVIYYLETDYLTVSR